MPNITIRDLPSGSAVQDGDLFISRQGADTSDVSVTAQQLKSYAVPNTVTAEVDFGFLSGQENNVASVTVAATWATSSSVIICAPIATATADHDPDDYALEGIKAYATNIVDGVGFDIIASADYATFGKYNINAIGV